MEKHRLIIESIRVPAKRRKTLDDDKVTMLAEDILENGQKVAISVRPDAKGFVLIEGLHRLEALRALGELEVDAYLVRARIH